MTQREVATKTAFSYLGKPYIWGGDDPIEGFDCSGFCIEIGKSAGGLPRIGDWSAAALFRKGPEVQDGHEGCFVYFGNPATREVTHMEYCLDERYSIGASGGNRTTTTLATAARQNAFIQIRPFRTRPGLIGFTDIFIGGEIV